MSIISWLFLFFYITAFRCTDREAVIKQTISLSEEVKETSGLAFHNDMLYTHNDAGNKNVLYALDKDNGEIQSRFEVIGAKNVDWEDLAQNDEYIFIGDIGNNDGNRRDLKIYKVKKDQFIKNGRASVKVDGVIEFNYGDQENFDPQKNHNYDSEALIYFDRHLYLFSKNRGGTLCNVYKIPSDPGTYTAIATDSFNIKGRITGAAIAPSQTSITLTGYDKKEDCFLYRLEQFTGDRFFSGKVSKINLGSYKDFGQLEAVAFADEHTLYLSSEKTKSQKPKLYKLKF